MHIALGSDIHRHASRDAFLEGFRAVLPIAVVIAALGVLLGHAARMAGFSPLAAAVMSATTFAGGAQFAAIAVFGDGGSIAAAVGTAVAPNARYALMGATLLAPTARGGVANRLLVAHLTVDETWAVAHAGNVARGRERLIGAGIVLLVVHVASTALGAAMGTSLGNVHAWGLDSALPALFVVLLWPRLVEPGGADAALTGAAFAVVLTLITPPGVPIIGAAVAGVIRPRRPSLNGAPG
jgi:predicted branched-subunit amino acid permease